MSEAGSRWDSSGLGGPFRGPRGSTDGDSVLLVPGPHRGSVEHFYHFVLGYLAPAERWLDARGPLQPVVRQCGSLDGWFELLPAQHRPIVIPAEQMREAVDRGSVRSAVLSAYDHPRAFSTGDLPRFAGSLLALVGASGVGIGPPVVVLDRIHIDPHLVEPTSEVFGTGPMRRSTPNLAGLVERMGGPERVLHFDPSTMLPRNQIRSTRSARVLIGQHGAGLVHMLWMPPGSTVVEIRPVAFARRRVFERLAAVLGHRHVHVPQAGMHATVDLDLVVASTETELDRN